jgi:protein-S-isoprenylcysteine O-methyltransferase Ste14
VGEKPLKSQRWKWLSGYTLDAVERVIVACLYAYFVYNIAADILARGNLVSLILLISESAVLVFVLLRRPTADITSRPADWAFGFAGTTAALLVLPAADATPLLPGGIILALMLGGAVLQITAKFFLRRSFGIVAANRGVKVGGPYRYIRHPMYAGYILNQFGFLLANPTARNLAIYSLCWGFQICRILAEERLLIRDEAYRGLVARVPYRLIPKVF